VLQFLPGPIDCEEVNNPQKEDLPLVYIEHPSHVVLKERSVLIIDPTDLTHGTAHSLHMMHSNEQTVVDDVVLSEKRDVVPDLRDHLHLHVVMYNEVLVPLLDIQVFQGHCCVWKAFENCSPALSRAFKVKSNVDFSVGMEHIVHDHKSNRFLWHPASLQKLHLVKSKDSGHQGTLKLTDMLDVHWKELFEESELTLRDSLEKELAITSVVKEGPGFATGEEFSQRPVVPNKHVAKDLIRPKRG
jgi:hypothetical protein